MKKVKKLEGDSNYISSPLVIICCKSVKTFWCRSIVYTCASLSYKNANSQTKLLWNILISSIDTNSQIAHNKSCPMAAPSFYLGRYQIAVQVRLQVAGWFQASAQLSNLGLGGRARSGRLTHKHTNNTGSDMLQEFIFRSARTHVLPLVKFLLSRTAHQQVTQSLNE